MSGRGQALPALAKNSSLDCFFTRRATSITLRVWQQSIDFVLLTGVFYIKAVVFATKIGYCFWPI
jgi:hypothetical protein